MKKIYLAGPMLGCNKQEMSDWRSVVKAQLAGKFEFLDPVDLGTPETAIEVVEMDLEMIAKADILLANCWKASPGTSMEVCRAYMSGKKVVVVNTIKSPWLHYHSHVCLDTLVEALDYLREVAHVKLY